MPLWRVISETLSERVQRGVYGESFPGELSLAREFGVSRGTIRQALQPLRERGVVTASRGKAPQIAQQKPHSRYGAIYSLREIITESGARHTSVVLDQRVVPEDSAGELAEAGLHGPLFRLERVRFADGAPIAHDIIYAPAELAEPLVHIDFQDTAFYAALKEHAGVTIEGGHEDVRAVAAEVPIAVHLEQEPGHPLLLLTRVSESGGRVVEVRHTHVRSDRFTPSRAFGTLDL